MYDALGSPEYLVQAAITAMREGGRWLTKTLDAFPAAFYVTDAEGVVTHFNRNCIAFAGRMPRIGQDNWCVTWKLYTEDGEYLPHDQCPMAVAIRERRAVREVQAVAERPDGTLVDFRPYPTPVLDRSGNLVGAVNMLVDVGGSSRARTLRVKAAKCRRLVSLWPERRSALISMAEDYATKALGIERQH